MRRVWLKFREHKFWHDKVKRQWPWSSHTTQLLVCTGQRNNKGCCIYGKTT